MKFMSIRNCAIAFLLPVALLAAADQPALKPPPHSKVAVIVFEDLQCPDCAHASLAVKEETQSQKVPLVRHDFPLAKHDWAYRAAVLARYFDAKGAGDAFRDYVYLYQPQITAANLRQKAEEFASSRNLPLPAEVDPSHELAAAVNADMALGRKIGIQHTPTIYVVTNQSTSAPLIEVISPLQLSMRIREAVEHSK